MWICITLRMWPHDLLVLVSAFEKKNKIGQVKFNEEMKIGHPQGY